jgi:hypothetical protein
MQFEVGMELYFVYSDSRRGEPIYVKVSKVGRKWVNLDNGYRFDKEDTVIDGAGYSSPGRIYLSKEDYDNQCKKDLAIRAINKRTDFYSYEGPSLEDVLAAAKLLKVPGYE